MEEQSTLFKDVFFKGAFFDELTKALDDTLKDFNKSTFINAVLDNEWQHKELKKRTTHLTEVLHQFLPTDFPLAAKKLVQIIENLRSQNIQEVSFGYIALAEYVERYGLEHYDDAMAAMEYITTFVSCEFAIRPFIINYPAKTMKQMLKWSKHKNAKVRRLASEGCRPRLPWGIALRDYKKDPSVILPILENLKTDEDVWVRKSVANNLNDISKDNPELAIDIFKRWYGANKHTDWIVKHAARTLLKQGNEEVMSLFGLQMDDTIVIDGFDIHTPHVVNGKELKFSFSVHNSGKENKVIRLEYGMYYLRANGAHSKKVFKISEREYQAGEQYTVQRKQSFKPITTRRYYLGAHKLSLIINGHEVEVKDFHLV